MKQALTKCNWLIRKASPSDWPDIAEICCLTADSGHPIDRDRWKFFQQIWISTYQRFCPDWSYVAELDGRVVGYLTGCAATVKFKTRRRQFDLILAFKIISGRFGWDADVKRFLKRALGLEKSGEQIFGSPFNRKIWNEYPAHLHMNFRAEARSGGGGRALLERYFLDLKLAKVRGVHLFCGVRPVVFYSKMGFEEKGRAEMRPLMDVFALGRMITD